MRLDADVLIVGGGLAGSATAIGLARRGLSSLIIDKADFPRDKPCGEGLLPHGVSLLSDLGLADVLAGADAQPFEGILYHCGDVVARGDFRAPALRGGGDEDSAARAWTGLGVRRRILDDAIRQRAATFPGVSFLHSNVKSVVQVSLDTDVVAQVVLADGRTLSGRFLVGADGPRSVVRHTLGLDGGPPRRKRFALRRHYRALGPLPRRVEVHVERDHELYVTPVATGVIGVAALCEQPLMKAQTGDPGDRLATLIRACPLVHAHVDLETPESRALACGPLRVRSRTVTQGLAVLVGDAAGYVDAITGEGMSLALQTAVFAADAIADTADGADIRRAFSTYRRRRARVFRDHAILTFGLVELAQHPRLARRAIARLAKEPALFSRLLAVNDGQRTFFSLGLADLLKLAVGSSPPAQLPADAGAE